ncbi:hydroxyacid dehydrogenase [Mesorhizobium sp. B2-6-2]|uniref:hydroxyacid dehydrogenase n=1 Tax=Mesorhizobium sp. B2-6-2 TaxID=2589915 RepID=UPI00112D6B16|nr:hydroxyacid dehydrogenase [Mesorhizobium sp. B2-6-2]TPJ79141.1 hydroxyacid dehydrogenase [Mesorhizobium sp. B2-6-2]
MPEGPLILIADPEPRTLAMIFEPEAMARLKQLGTVRVHADGQHLSNQELDAALARAAIVIGQIDLPAERLAGMGKLKAIFNVEGNFLPNIDYGWCFQHGIHVLNTSPVYATSVAETALGMALDLCREITSTHEAFRSKSEKWGLESNGGSFLLTGTKVGIVGLGDLGSALRRMLMPFRCEVRVFDPWLSERRVREQDCIPSDLDDVFRLSRVVFLFASSTSENQGSIGKRELDLMQRGSVLLVMSRAGIIDFESLEASVRSGHVRAGIDVFPVEPLSRDSALRHLEGVILSSHRSGGMPESFLEIGRLVVADSELILRGLPPQACKRAERETVARMRSRPVSKS